MFLSKRVLFIIIILISISISGVSATNLTDSDSLGMDGSFHEVICEVNESQSDPVDDNVNESKEVPTISVDSLEVYEASSIGISLKDSNNAPISNQNLTANINDENYSLFTNEKGIAQLKIWMPAKTYALKVFFMGNENYSAVNNTFDIDVLKINAGIFIQNSTLLRGNYLEMFLKNEEGNGIRNAKINFLVNDKTYKVTTDTNGLAKLKINLYAKDYPLEISFPGSSYYNSVSKAVKLVVIDTTSLVIGNSRLLTNGHLRVYLKSDSQSLVSKKKVKIVIDGKTIVKTTNNEGMIIFKPKLSIGIHEISATFQGNKNAIKSNASKKINCVNGDTKNPFKSKIPLKNGVPDVDRMTVYFAMADGNMKYTLTKAQYLDVIKRDSYCLFLNNKLSKYVIFKSKAEPTINHIIKREKWNVIERAINTKIVKKNKYGYWPSQITVLLKEKSYTYAEVRDEQNTDYTCGPTSASMCSQVLKKYVNEKYLAKQAGTSSVYGSSTKGLKKALEKNNFKCSIYYKSSFDKALKQLKKGGCALIFHTWNHYVSILDISKDGKKVLVGNPSGDYDHGSHKIPTKWLTVKYMKGRFNDYDTSGLIVKLKYNLKKSTKTKLNKFYYSMGSGWTRQNTSERIPQIGY